MAAVVAAATAAPNAGLAGSAASAGAEAAAAGRHYIQFMRLMEHLYRHRPDLAIRLWGRWSEVRFGPAEVRAVAVERISFLSVSAGGGLQTVDGGGFACCQGRLTVGPVGTRATVGTPARWIRSLVWWSTRRAWGLCPSLRPTRTFC